MSNLGFAGHTGSKQLLNSAAVVWKPQTTCKWRSMAGDRTDLAPDHSSANPCSKSSQLRKPLLSYDLKVYWEGYEPESDFLGLKSPLSSSPSQWHSGTWSSLSLFIAYLHTQTHTLCISPPALFQLNASLLIQLPQDESVHLSFFLLPQLIYVNRQQDPTFFSRWETVFLTSWLNVTNPPWCSRLSELLS